MMVLISYDVETQSSSGKRRLRQVARQCVNYGQRVQNSVFECVLDPTIFAQLKHNLLNIIDVEKDSLRFYMMGNNWKNRVEHYGNNASYNPEEDTLIL